MGRPNHPYTVGGAYRSVPLQCVTRRQVVVILVLMLAAVEAAAKEVSVDTALTTRTSTATARVAE